MQDAHKRIYEIGTIIRKAGRKPYVEFSKENRFLKRAVDEKGRWQVECAKASISSEEEKQTNRKQKGTGGCRV